MKDLGQEILLQEFIRESRGRDVRVLVIGDRAVAAMRRQARAGEFRSNLHRGGEGKPVEAAARLRRRRGAGDAHHGAGARGRGHARDQERARR